MRSIYENVEIRSSPLGLEQEYFEVFTDDSIKFVADLATEFQLRIHKVSNFTSMDMYLLSEIL
jgi:hypothetical protein